LNLKSRHLFRIKESSISILSSVVFLTLAKLSRTNPSFLSCTFSKIGKFKLFVKLFGSIWTIEILEKEIFYLLILGVIK